MRFFISSWRVTLHKTSFFLEDTTFVNYLKKRLMLLILMEETMTVKGKAYTLSFNEPLKYSLFISAVFRCRLVIYRRFKKGRSGLWTVSMNNTQASKKKRKRTTVICPLDVAEGLRTVRSVLPHGEVNSEPLNNFKQSVDNHNDKLLILLDECLAFLLVPFSSAEVLHLGLEHYCQFCGSDIRNFQRKDKVKVDFNAGTWKVCVIRDYESLH